MSRYSKNIAAAIVVAALLISVASSAFAAQPRRVVVVLAPYLTWTDIASMPNARQLAQTSLLADMNVRAGGVLGSSTPDRGALVLSAGAPVSLADGALTAYNATESVGAGPASDLYLQYFATAPRAAAIVFPGQPKQVAANADPNGSPRIGFLGSAVRAAGARTVAIGNSDLGMAADPFHASRPAAVAAADESGTVDAGDVSDAMLIDDPASPYGVRANAPAIIAELRSAAPAGTSAVVFVDPGDLFRANTIASSVTTGAAATQRAWALTSTDDVIGGLIRELGPKDVLVVVSQAVVSVADTSAGYGPLIVHDGSGVGIATSGSTHRDGLVTAMDLSGTISELLTGKIPTGMAGSRVRIGTTLTSGSVEERMSFLDTLNTASVAVESVRMTVVNYFIVLSVIVLLLATFVQYRSPDRVPAWAPRATRIALLVPLGVLLGAVLQFVAFRWPTSGTEVVWELVGATALVTLVALATARSGRATLPLIALTGATTLALLVDQWLGAPLSRMGLFGYSPLLGARYYGMGNEMAGLVMGSAAVLFGLTLDTWRDARWVKLMRVWGWPVLGLVLLATAAAPFWGANVGPAAWMTVGFLIGWLMFNGKKVVTWRNLALVVVIIVVVVAGLSALDLARGADSQTHLGKAIIGAESGGIGTLWTIIARKAETNARIIGRTNWTWMLVAVLVLLGYMRWRPRGEFAAMLKRYPAFSVAVAVALFAGVTGYFTEDSGIIIPALMCVPVGVTALYLMLLPHASTEGENA